MVFSTNITPPGVQKSTKQAQIDMLELLTDFTHEEDLAREKRHEEGIFSPDDFSPLTEEKLYMWQVDPLAPPAVNPRKKPKKPVAKAQLHEKMKKADDIAYRKALRIAYAKALPPVIVPRKGAGPPRGVSVSPTYDLLMSFPAANAEKMPDRPPAKTNKRVMAARLEAREKLNLDLPPLSVNTRPAQAGKKVKPKPGVTRNTRAAAKKRISAANRKPKADASIQHPIRSSGRDVTPVTFTPNPEFKRETRSATKKAANNATASSVIKEVTTSKSTTKATNKDTPSKSAAATTNEDTPSTMSSFTAINTPQTTVTTPATIMSSQTGFTAPSSGDNTPSKCATRSSKKDATPPSSAPATTSEVESRPRPRLILKNTGKVDETQVESGESSNRKRRATTPSTSSDSKGKGNTYKTTDRPSKKRKTAAAQSGADEDDSDDDNHRNKKRKAAEIDSSSSSDHDNSDEDTDSESKPPKKKRATTAKTSTNPTASTSSTSKSDPTTLLTTQWQCANRLCNTGQTWHPRDSFGRKAISNFFGRNKTSTKAIDDDVWHIYCRKDYQRSSYEGKKKNDKDNERRKRDFQIKNIEIQLTRLEIWRPNAQFHVRLVKGAQSRLAGYHKSIRDGKSIDEANAEAQAKVQIKTNSKGSAVPLSLEDAFPCKLMDVFTSASNNFVSAGAGINKNDKKLEYDKSYADIARVMAWVKEKIAAGEAECLPPMEFLIKAKDDEETGETAAKENYDRWCAFEDKVPYTGQRDSDMDGKAPVPSVAPAGGVVVESDGAVGEVEVEKNEGEEDAGDDDEE